MIAILKIIAQNTSFINDIFDLVKNILAGGGSGAKEAPKPPKHNVSTRSSSGRGGEVDASLRAAVMTLAAIAKG